MKDRNKGILLMILGSLFAALMAAFVKYSGDMPTAEKLFFRSLVGTVIAGYLIIRSQEPFFGHNKKLLVMRGTLGFLGLFLYFIAIERLPLGNAVILNQVSPFFTIIFALFFLRERVFIKQWVAIAVAMTGVVFISKPGPGYTVLAAMAGLFSAVFSGASHTTIRELRKTDKPHTVVFYFTGLTCFVSIPFLLAGQYQAPTPLQLGSILAAGLAATISQLLITYAYRYAEAGDLSIYLYGNTIFSLILGYILWQENPGYFSLLGVVLVFFGAYINWKSKKTGMQQLLEND